jgi:predicted metalloprotease with PDZ domain
LWVYEGQTQFWGYVLQARSGLATKQETLDMLAAIAANLDNRPGRDWRALVDTTNDPIISARQPQAWTSWQRSEDYYNEGLLVWLEVDSILRAKSGGKKSIDDFARAFFGLKHGDWGVVTYTFDDVAKALNDIVPNDWAGFLTQRLTETGKPAPLNGFVNNGYRLIYTDEQTPALKTSEKDRGGTDLAYSLGFAINKTNAVSAVRWGGPAFEQGLRIGDELVAVNGTPVTVDALKKAVTAAKGTKDPIKLLLKLDGAYREIAIDYHGGLRYPRLEKTGSGEAGLDRLLAPLK